jgi:hypothetical protein
MQEPADARQGILPGMPQVRPTNKDICARARARAEAGGYCVSCRRKDKIPSPGHKTCQSCIDAQAERNQRKLQAGICRNCCKMPRLEGLNTCARCKIAAKLLAVRRYAARAASGLCRFTNCQNVRDPGYSSCVNCRARVRMMRGRKK